MGQAIKLTMTKLEVLFGSNLKRLRSSRDMSQDMLASAVDTDQRTISLYENGHQFPEPERIEKIVKALNINVHELFIDKDNQLLDYAQFYADINSIVTQYKSKIT